MDWQLIESDEALAALLARAQGCDAVTVDTEFMRRNTFYPKVALAQLCFSGGGAAGTAWLLDPLRIADSAPLVRLFEDTGVVKVLHSASEDIEVFQHWLGALPDPLFDTQKAAALVGFGFGVGYRGLVLDICGVDLPKGETRSDWLQRPLSEPQCEYAAQDVILLLEVYRHLAALCRQQGRYDWVLEDGAEACRNPASGSGAYYRRVKNAWKLAPLELATLMAVCDWRDGIARSEDRPRSWVIDDEACLQLARSRPRDMNQLRAQVPMHPAALRRYGPTLLELVAAQDGLAPQALPERLPGPLSAAERNRLKLLKARTEAIAGELGVAPQALVAGKDYEVLLRDGEECPASWDGWRRERVIEPLRRYLQGMQA